MNSNASINALESDAVFVQTVRSLVELSQYRLKEVAGALASLLDAIFKVGRVSVWGIDIYGWRREHFMGGLYVGCGVT